MIKNTGLVKSILDKHLPSIGRWKCDQQDPRKHDSSHIGQIYQYPKDTTELTEISGHNVVFGKDYDHFLKTIDMTPIMVRQPALTVMDKIRENLTKTDNEQILIYGDPGHGKAHTLAHLYHFSYLEQNMFIINFRWMWRFTYAPTEYKVSTSRPGRIDTPIDAAMILQCIRTQNKKYLEKNNISLTCSQDYKWSAREETKAGEPLDAIIDHGTNRVIHASDCLAVLLKELMIAADQGKIRLLTYIKDANLLFDYRAGVLRHPDYKYVIIDELTVARSIKKLIKGNYKNSLVIASCDDKNSETQNHTPESVFPEKGSTYFEKATRIHVPKYNRIEFENIYDFYQDIGWLARPESRTQEIRDEIRFCSGLNPGQVFELCKNL